jgi:hypothetical protein
MKRPMYPHFGSRRGSSLILALIFVAVFGALAVSMATMSGMNLQIAESQRRSDTARSCALSGVEVVRYWMNRVSISGTTPAEQRFAKVATSLETVLTNAGVTNIVPTCSGSTVTLASVPLDAGAGQTFSAMLTRIDNDTIRLDVTGQYRGISRTIRSHFVFDTRAHTVFDFGVASKGPVALTGNIDLDGVTIDVESNAYIESEDSLLALSIIGNSHIAGTVKIGNPLACVYLQGGRAGIGGATGDAATREPYTQIGVGPTEFPEMTVSGFASYATTTIDASTNTSADATFTNIRIPAGLNPTFSGHAILKGVMWIESPNVVTFTGTTDVTGIIVANGDPADYSGANKVVFQGNVNSWPVSSLPDVTAFAGLRDKIGTFLIAPGFKASFGGSFGTLSGAIAANGIDFHGNAGGIIRGSVINYASTQMTLSGNSDLYFNRSGLTNLPAGFTPELIIAYDRSSYSEVAM